MTILEGSCEIAYYVAISVALVVFFTVLVISAPFVTLLSLLAWLFKYQKEGSK